MTRNYKLMKHVVDHPYRCIKFEIRLIIIRGKRISFLLILRNCFRGWRPKWREPKDEAISPIMDGSIKIMAIYSWFACMWEMAEYQPSLEAIIRVNASLARGNRPLGGLTTISLYRENNAR